jgi:hypothetical protein
VRLPTQARDGGDNGGGDNGGGDNGGGDNAISRRPWTAGG